MSFYASNNRIRVTDGAAQVFDTNQPMPHILQVLTANSIAVSFPASGTQSPHSHWTTQEQVNENVCKNRQKCGFQQQCGYEQQCGYQNVCAWGYQGGVYGYYCSNQYVCNQVWVCRDVYTCWMEYGCEYEWVWHTRYYCETSRIVLAREWEQVIDLGAILNDINADFILVNVNGSRTAAGAQYDYGTFVSAVPSTNFICQGSAILESAFESGGSSWLRRIMSVYVQNGRIKVKFKHSNRQITGAKTNGSVSQLDSQPHSQELVDNTASAFSFNFTIYIGKFN